MTAIGSLMNRLVHRAISLAIGVFRARFLTALKSVHDTWLKPWARSPPVAGVPAPTAAPGCAHCAVPTHDLRVLATCPAVARLRPLPRCCSPAAMSGSPCAPALATFPCHRDTTRTSCSTLPWPRARWARATRRPSPRRFYAVDIALAACALDDSLPAVTSRRTRAVYLVGCCPLRRRIMIRRLAATPCWLAPGATPYCFPMAMQVSNCFGDHHRTKPCRAWFSPVSTVPLSPKQFSPIRLNHSRRSQFALGTAPLGVWLRPVPTLLWVSLHMIGIS